ncbi:MAG: hypothetical protein POELPBGB_01393 [Bacteroidia bacterium]|nr:hypothetical protein [Bacteroidia bacterium]
MELYKTKSSDIYTEFTHWDRAIENRLFEENCRVIKLVCLYKAVFRNCHFEKDTLLGNCTFENDVLFNTCTFSEEIVFKNSEFKKGLKFENCTFQKELVFNDCTVHDILCKNSTGNEIYFSGYIKNNAVKNHEIIFDDVTFEKIKFEHIELFKPIKFLSVEFKEVWFHHCHAEAPMTFGDSEKDIYFKSKKIDVESSKFFHRIDFLKGVITEFARFHKVDFNEQVVWRDTFHTNSIELMEVRAKYDVCLDFRNNTTHLYFQNCWFDTSFTIFNINPALNSIEDRVTVDFYGIIHGNYIIADLPTLSITISCINFGNILFNNVSTKLIHLNRFYNYNKLFFNSIKLDPTFNVLTIIDSNINNTEFENIDFTKFNEVVITKSDVSSMLLSNSLFPKQIQIKTNNPQLGYGIEVQEEANRNMYFRESYRQLKMAMEKSGNRYYALLYKSKEMYYQRKEFGWGWDKILLTLNYLTNNNGISWGRGIVFTLLCALGSFFALNSLINEPYFYWGFSYSGLETLQAFKIGFKQYINYLSSYPRLTIDEGVTSNWKINSVVLLSRILVSIGIFQTIFAFRKYGK